MSLLVIAASSLAGEESRGGILEAYGGLPLRFERNESQVGGPVRYLARAQGYTMFVTPTEMVLALRRGDAPPSGPRVSLKRGPEPSGSDVLHVKLLRGRREAKVEGEEVLPGETNYLVGGDRRTWRRGVRSYARVRCREVYPGIDVVYHGSQGQLEYDFVVAPGADPKRIRLRFEGARTLQVDGEGNLVVRLPGGELTKRAPVLYQETGTTRRSVRGRWVLGKKKEARFEVGGYDPRQTLVIDPVLSYSTYLGGSNWENGGGIAVDSLGNVYITGTTYSYDFPTQNPYLTSHGFPDAFVTKLSASGQSLVYSTYLGGSGPEEGYGIAVDSSGSAYVTGVTYSTDFPTQNPVQTNQLSVDAFVAKLSPAGDSLIYSTYLGGSQYDIGYGIAVEGSGSAYVAGHTWSNDFPTQNPYQTYRGGPDVFVTKLSPTGSVAYSTYLGGLSYDRAYAIAVDTLGSAYVTGYTSSSDFPLQNAYQNQMTGSGVNDPPIDAFVTKLSPAGNSLVYSTYLGGDEPEVAYGIALDGTGSAYVTGVTESEDFPTQNPYQTDQPSSDVFVTKLSPGGNNLVYSTYLGGASIEESAAIAVDGVGSAYVTGYTRSMDFPTQNPLQENGFYDAFVTKLSPAGNSLVYSTYLGAGGEDRGLAVAVDAAGSAYVTGDTLSSDFPVHDPYQASLRGSGADAFVTKIAMPPMRFFTFDPCRLIDTREAGGPFGGPGLAAGADRVFTAAGRCGIPPTARALMVNVAVTAPSAAGNLRLFEAGATLPVVSSLNYGAGRTRGNNAVLALNSSGAFTVRCAQPSGTAHLIVDVSGYFQ